MNKKDIVKLNELIETLAIAAEAWHASFHVDVCAKLHIINDSVQPVLMIEYRLSQDEYTETLIEMPNIPPAQIEANWQTISFHILSLKHLLNSAPSEAEWREKLNLSGTNAD